MLMTFEAEKVSLIVNCIIMNGSIQPHEASFPGSRLLRVVTPWDVIVRRSGIMRTTTNSE